MSHTIPSIETSVLSLADVYPSCLASLGVSGQNNSLQLPPVRSSVIVLVDGLGQHNVQTHRAYARSLVSMTGFGGIMATTFPSTTATALATLTTGTFPGQHGIVGYKVRDPESGKIVNQLTGLTEQMLADGWLTAPPLYGVALDSGIASSVVSHPRFATTPLTQLLHAGATQIGARSFEERIDAVVDLSRKSGKNFVLLYISELDERAHKFGSDSAQWCDELERVDGALARLMRELPHDAGALVLADHGIVDVPTSHHVLYRSDDPALSQVSAFGGEPRCLQLYVQEAPEVFETIRDYFTTLGPGQLEVLRGEQLIASGWWGDVGKTAHARMGDIFVLATGQIALYDECDPARAGREMIGQHGAVSEGERQIPLIRAAAYA